MRTFSVFFCVLFLMFCRAQAQQTFAPLITENCIAFVHVDLSNLEISKLKDTLQKAGENLLTELQFDDRSKEATLRELTVELEKLDMLASPVYDTITKELGINEFTFVVNVDFAQGSPTILLALPWKNKTAEHLQTLSELFAMVGKDDVFARSHFIVGDLLFLTESNKKANVEPIVRGWLKQPTTSPGITAALESVPGSEVKIAVALPPGLREMIKSAPIPSEVPVQVRNLVLFAAQKIDWASTGGSFGTLLGITPAKEDDVFLTVKTTKRSDAVMLRGMLEQLIEFGINAAQFAAQQNREQNQMVQIPPLAFQFAKGLLRTMLPDVEEEKLIFRSKGSAYTQSAVAAAGMGTALLLPAIQTSREAARRMQCTNNMRQIVLAIHNFHDVKNALPPLYTVDKDGKPLHSWRVLLLPYMDQNALYSQIRLDEPWDSEHNKQFHNAIVNIYCCPDVNIAMGMCCYSAIAGEGFAPAKKAGEMGLGETFAKLVDGTSNSIAIVEVKEPFCWMDPTADITLDELAKGINKGGRVGSNHPGGCNVGMFDGSVRFAGETTDPEILRALGDCDDGKSLNF